MSPRPYSVVAMRFPIVYTDDGDHDPRGLLYALARHRPLLDWAKAQWHADDDVLPRLHRRRQLMQIVVDGLWRYGLMRDRLAVGPEEDRYLLHRVGGEEHHRHGVSPRAAEVAQNLHATLDELAAALEELTDGTVTEVNPDPAVRAAWSAEWTVALADTTQQIEARLAAIQPTFDPVALATASGLTPAEVRRLLLNDHGAAGPGPAAYTRFNPLRPIPLVRPLVLRARAGETVTVELENSVAGRRIGLHVQGDGIAVRTDDGGAVGTNPASTVRPGKRRTYTWQCHHEGVRVINDLGDVRGTEVGTNVHGLFGALIVEAPGATWTDPETGSLADGPYADVDPHDGTPAHREFTVFLHDEPEIHSGMHLVGEHTVMPLSYRAEPMPNRLPHRMRRYAERTSPEPAFEQEGIDLHAVGIEIDEQLGEVFRVARTADGRFLERVAGEEQHHSSWLFGDPVTPIFRAYRGDPARIRLVHAGVKETHVFHLHVHQWRAIPQDPTSQLLDSITIGPQTAVTIDPLYGSGSRQEAVGDVIWHCHLYPHFHHGMWGLWRSFDRLVDGSRPYPDGTPSHPLLPLPGRLAPTAPSAAQPGFPWFVDAAFPQKSPPPPAILDEHVVGRRRLLGMPNHSATELAAFAPGCVANPQPGALFVDLDGDAETWNDAAGLGEPRVISYDIEVREDRVEHNSDGWHDRHGHHYRISGIAVTETDAAGVRATLRVDPPPLPGIEPFFPRANHGDVVELRMHNELGTIPADHFDLTTPPVECGLHVHLVKFDVLAADGSSTGWNYLAGASTREAVDPDVVGRPPGNVGFHRWVVDEEFGPCFFHDHLLANYRQKHGLFAALIAEPHGSQWLRPDQETVAWSGPEAVIVPPAGGLPPYREACLAVGDFVPLYAGDGTPLNPPHELSGEDDPGAMAVNYRCAPLTFRGDDPSEWFAGKDPDTAVVLTYPGERLRIRLVQGSHEEQHSFSTHGLRWRQEWQNPASRLVNQQTLGISEAFTLDIDPAASSPYGPGDHLWQFAAMDDLWLGCWGLVRALLPGEGSFAVRPPLPAPGLTPAEALDRLRSARAVPPRPARDAAGDWPVGSVQEITVVARRHEHRYDGTALTDPWGLIYRVSDGHEEDPTRPGFLRAVDVSTVDEPLVLRARRGQWVRVVLINEVLDGRDTAPGVLPFAVEPSPPPLPLEPLDEESGYPTERRVSPRVSLHPGLLRYDVVGDDGAYVGHNHDGTAGTLGERGDAHAGGHPDGDTVVFRDPHGVGHGDVNWREYWWYADDDLAPASYVDGPGQVCHLQDMADVRNHRHHGLVGALVVEPGDVVPYVGGMQQWWGAAAELRTADGTQVANEQVLVVQDGLRHFLAGNPDSPVRDTVPNDDPEDAGQKGINYRCAPVHPAVVLARTPGTPLWEAAVGDVLWLRLVCAADKPRNHTFTVHGMAWEVAPWVAGGPRAGSLSGLTAGVVHDLVMAAQHPGDHAYRSGVFRWAVEQGLWGILRIRP